MIRVSNSNGVNSNTVLLLRVVGAVEVSNSNGVNSNSYMLDDLFDLDY